MQLFSSVWHKYLISTLRNLSIGKTQIQLSRQYNINTNNCSWASVHCHLAWEEQPSPMMQAWLASLVWQGTPSTETTGLTVRGFVILKFEVLCTIRTSFFFNASEYSKVKLMIDNSCGAEVALSCIKLQKYLNFYIYLWLLHSQKLPKKGPPPPPPHRSITHPLKI